MNRSLEQCIYLLFTHLLLYVNDIKIIAIIFFTFTQLKALLRALRDCNWAWKNRMNLKQQIYTK